MTTTRARRAGALAALTIPALSLAGVDPARDGYFPCGYSTHLQRAFSIEVESRRLGKGISLGTAARSLAIGDVDNDGVDDIVMGFAECALGDCDTLSGVVERGLVRVYSGATGEIILELTGREWTTLSQIDGFGWAVALADLTGDGRMDILVGAPLANSFRGRVEAFSADGERLYTLEGPTGAQRYGELIITVGKADADDADDFLVLDTAALGRAPTLWARSGADGALLHSRTVLSHRVSVVPDADNDGVPEYVCGAPDLPIPRDRARAFRADTGALAYQFLASEGYIAWLGDINDDSRPEVVQFNSLFAWNGPSQYTQLGGYGLPNFPLPLRTIGAFDFDADGALDVLTRLTDVLDFPDPSIQGLALTSARLTLTGGLFSEQHRALVDGEWLAHDYQNVAAGNAFHHSPGDTAADLAVALFDEKTVADRFVVGLYAGPWLPGDVNHDGVVNFDDLNDVLTRFGRSASKDARGDADCSGQVDTGDLLLVLEFFGDRNPTPARQAGRSLPAHR